MSRPVTNTAPPTPPATPPPQDEQDSNAQNTVTTTLNRTVGKGALQSGLAGGLGQIALLPFGGLVGGLVGVIYGASLASTEGIREKYQPDGWGANGVPPTYVQPVDNSYASQKKFSIQNGGFPHGSPSQRRKQNPRTESVQKNSQKRTSSSPGPQPERAIRPKATPRSTLRNSSPSLSGKKITSMTPLPPVPNMDAPGTPTPRQSRSPSPSVSPRKKITSMSPIPKLDSPSTSTIPAKASPPAQQQRKTLPSNPRPQKTTAPATKVTPSPPPANPTPTPKSHTTVSSGPQPGTNSTSISAVAQKSNASIPTGTPSLMPTPLAPVARRNPGRRRKKGGANGSESSGSQAGDAAQDRKLSIIDTYLG